MGSDHNNSHPISAGCNTGLSLGLGGLNSNHHLHLNNNSSTDNQKQQQQQQPTLRFDHVVPSLSLGPVTVNYDDPNTVMLSSPFISTGGGGGGSSISPSNPHLLILSSSNISPGRSSSSYSNNNSSFKRCSEDEVEGSVLDYTNTNKVVASSSRVISDEDEEASPRKKLRLTKDQSAVLEDSFKEHSTLNPSQKQALAKQLNLRPRQVEVWFQNRRARTKLKQTEMDRELLKKCYDTLTEENNKLQREIQQLKALHNNTPTTVNTNNQGATLSLCSSCERRARIAAAGSNSYNHSHQHVSASYNNGTTMSGVTATNNPPRELSFKIASSSAAC